MTSTACDDQWTMDREEAIDDLARTVLPMEWEGGGDMYYAGHTITWGEYCMRRHDLEDEEESEMKRDEMLTKLAMELEYWPTCASTAAMMLPPECGMRFKERVITCRDISVDGNRMTFISEWEWLAERERLINEPSWDDAPEWAQWLAQDESGRWMWYGDKPLPVYDAGEWQPESGKFLTASHGVIPAGHDWRNTLEERLVSVALSRDAMLTHLAKTLRDWPRDCIECEQTEPGHGWCWFDVAPDCESVLGVPGRDGIGWTITEKEWEAACWAEGEARIDRIAQSDASGEHYDQAPTKYHVRLNGKWCDVYDVLQAFEVTNPADAHAIKKMLMPGKRGHKGGVQDRQEAIQSLRRAIELEEEQ